MKTAAQLKTATPPILITLALVCFGFLSAARAVVPAPDGGYPGGNTAEGQNALLSLTTGGFNTAIGFLSAGSNTTGSFNTAIGAGTLLANTRDGNTAIGAGALLSNTTGSGNTAIGRFALQNNTTGSNNIALGADAGFHVITANDVICIGAGGANVVGTCFISSIRGVTTQNANAIPVLIDSASQLGTASSSRRYKREIKPMDSTSEAILALKPVSFHYKSDTTNTPQFGLIAEEVAAVNPDLIVRDDKGEIYTVRYDAVNAMLLNEFLKEHKKVEAQDRRIQEQDATITQQRKDFEAVITDLRKELETVVTRLKEHDSRIERVSAQIEVSAPAARIALSNP